MSFQGSYQVPMKIQVGKNEPREERATLTGSSYHVKRCHTHHITLSCCVDAEE